jgi:hypothetical protein
LLKESPVSVQQRHPGESKHEQNLFSVLGQKLTGHAIALIIAATEADAEYYALHELGFVTVSSTSLLSDSVYVHARTHQTAR